MACYNLHAASQTAQMPWRKTGPLQKLLQRLPVIAVIERTCTAELHAAVFNTRSCHGTDVDMIKCNAVPACARRMPVYLDIQMDGSANVLKANLRLTRDAAMAGVVLAVLCAGKRCTRGHKSGLLSPPDIVSDKVRPSIHMRLTGA
jgi:hypothetical protein